MPRSTFARRSGLTLFALLGCAAAQAQPRYTLTDFSAYWTAPGTAFGAAINDSGQVAGTVFDETSRSTPFLYTPGSGIQDLGQSPPAGATAPVSGYASALNNAGQVTGEWQDGRFGKPFVYSAATGMVDLAGVGPDSFQSGLGRSINDAGQVYGGGATAAGEGRDFLYHPTTGMRALPTPALTSAGGDINNAGTLVGTSSAQRATSYDSTGFHDLGTLRPGGTSYANAINDAGTVVGYADVLVGDSFSSHAFIHTAANGMVDLSLLGGLDPRLLSAALDINERGQVAGTFRVNNDEDPGNAFLFDSAYGLLDLNNLLDPASGAGWHLMLAESINEKGQILGRGEFGGMQRTFLLTPVDPVPEPATWALMGIGLVLLAWKGAARGRERSAASG